MSDLFTAHKQMSGIYKSSIIKLLSRIIENELTLPEITPIAIRGKKINISSIIVTGDSEVFIRGTWGCCPGSSCTISDEGSCINLQSLSPDDVVIISEEILKYL